MEVSDLNQVSPLSFGWYSGQQRLGSLWCWRNISGAVGSPFDVSTAPFSFFACPCFCSVPFIYVCHSYSFINLSYSFLFLSLSFCFAYAGGIQGVALSPRLHSGLKSSSCLWGGSLPTGKVFSVFSIPGSLIFIGILLRLPTTRIHSVNSCPALSHTQASAFSGETLAVLSAGISKRWPKYRLPIDIARPCSETPFPQL